MIKEGFSESDIIAALLSGRILEDYPDEARCLILGFFGEDPLLMSPLHVLCDYSYDDLVDVVTAYVPQKPWWQTETKRGSIQ